MNADHLSYQRATSVSIIGLVVQLVLGVALLLYGILLDDPTARSGAFVVFYGAPVWLALALVFHQHKRERLEARDNEAYRTSGASAASVFGDDELGETVQADKLAWMHRFFLPAVSLTLAAVYIITGLARFGADVRNYVEPDVIEAPPQGGAAVAVGVALLVVCFILARFVAGMAKQKAWSLLHAGAAASVGSALIGALLLLVHGLELGIGSSWGHRFGPAIVDGFMIFLGAEIVLNFILTVYRPRKTGEYLRPAFDSRILAFLAAPDRLAESVSDAINYQLGFDVSSTWFYRLVSRSVVGLAILTALSLWLMTSFAVVQPDERGLLLAGGEFVEEVESGTVIKRPWPFATVQTYPADAVSSFTVGVPTTRENPNAPLLWTDPNPTQDRFLVAQATVDPEDAEDGPATALLIAEIPVQYTVTDLRKYMGLAQDGAGDESEVNRRGVLRSTASSVVTRFFLRHTVAQFIGEERTDLEAELRADLQRAYDDLPTLGGTGAGVRVIFAGLQGVRPPREVATAYEGVDASTYQRLAAVEQARAERIRALSGATGDVDLAGRIVDAIDRLDEAEDRADDPPTPEQEARLVDLQREAEELLAEAGGDAAVAIIEARAERWRRHLGERARAVLSEGQAAGYEAAPDVYRINLLTEALRQSASGARLWITPLPVEVDFDFTEANTDFTGLEGVTGPEDGNEDQE